MNFGGPVWHASIMAAPGTKLPRKTMERLARKALDGVGDSTRGEWVEVARALHLRRRLSAEEETVTGPSVDIRGTLEYEHRLDPVRHLLPVNYRE